MDLRREHAKALFLVGLVLGVAGLAVAYSLTNTVEVDGPVPIVAPDGPNATFVGNSNQVNLSQPFPDANTVRLATDAGNITFKSVGETNLTIRSGNITGDWTNVTELDVASNELFLNPEDKLSANVSGDADEFGYKGSISLDDGVVDFYYAGTSGTTTVTIRGVPANTEMSAVNQSGKVKAVATSNGDGNVTFSSMGNSAQLITIQSGSQNNPPELTNPDPSGDVSTFPTQLSIDLDDADFPNDQVTLEFYWDGSLRDTQTVSSAGTYSTSNLPTITGGNHNYTVKATDDLGLVDKEITTVGIPGELHIRNETNASELVDSPVNVTIRWNRDDSDIVFTNTTNTGVVNMTGLPVTDFIVEVDPDQDYINRTAYIPTTIGQDSVYTLNKSYTTVETRFTLSDPTGQFGSDSILFVKRAINKSGTIKYRTVHADKFGAEGVPTQLQKDVRYRISVRSSDNVTQDIGPYRATTSEVVEVRPGAPVIELGETDQEWQVGASQNEDKLFASYNDTENLTTKVTIYIHERGNESNQFRPNTTYFDQDRIDAQYTFNPGENQTRWQVWFVIERNGTTHSVFELTGPQRNVFGLPGNWGMVVGLLVMFIFAPMFSILNRAIGAVMIPMVGGLLYWLGFLSGAATGASIIIALGVGMIYSVYISGGP